ncbi:YgiQ family radical SAM protein [Caldithrix abyssi]|uniref:Putative radical SAM protein YgiQ n=1 Tax=Caldithrix abyssi DSM 13497 TaxID=880073 RepID=A0A1J1CCT1_CALAY|nr:YgiQ family radical SAM protein [Caldithrix abyssi]APF19704.1 putative radical SAM protein YgiQ [Caldithrix abyssi DSM 13497]
MGYVDHPAFGTAVIGRLIETEGLRVAIVPQPNWRDDLRDFKKFGRPRLFFAVTAGVMDSMVNHYTARKRRRSNDAYTPGGVPGFRPDYPTIVYTSILKELFPEVPVVIGGVEASLRRLTHYDYWADRLRPSILFDSGADLLIYGMGEQPLRELLRLLKKGVPFHTLKTIRQTAILLDSRQPPPKVKKWNTLELASFETCLKDKKAFARNFKFIEKESNTLEPGTVLLQKTANKTVWVNPPFPVMSEKEMDYIFDLPYTRLPHPKYKRRGPIPAYEMIRHSINMHRGCFGGCSFCTISAHQGKFIASRSKESILKEARAITQMPDFKGYISDMGGPSANMYRMAGIDLDLCKQCKRASCIFPNICFNLNIDHRPMIDIYRSVAQIPGVKKAFVSSGIRYDLLVSDQKAFDKKYGLSAYLEQVVLHHVSGRLKVAPEHTSERVLRIMRKPSFKTFFAFKKKFDAINRKYRLKQQLIPYFISSHPGSALEDMAELAAITKELGFHLEQVQDFTPTPMTLATVIYYSGYHPYTLQKVYTAHTIEEKTEQNRFFFWYKKENRGWIRKQLSRMRRPYLLKKLLG